MHTRERWFRRYLFLIAVLVAGTAVPRSAGAQEGRTFTACYVPDVGAVYLIQEEGLPSACLATSHVEFSWTDGGGGIMDHGGLDGLVDDDHPQYLLADGVRDATDGFAVTGTVGSGAIPVEGGGTRLMWYAGKAAFRAGEALGTEWDDASVGRRSFATGSETVASGVAATATGSRTTASGQFATAMGNGTTASENAATAMGDNATASAIASTALGASTTADGFAATATGVSTTASADASTAMGRSTAATRRAATAMGEETTASRFAATAMGWRTTASGQHSTAMGHRARARHLGSFVWADGENVDFASSGDNQFLIRAAGGVGIGTNSPDEPLSFEGVIGPKINLFDGGGIYGFGMAPAELRIGTFDATKHISLGHYSGSSKSFVEWMRVDAGGNVGIGTSSPGFTLHVDGDVGKPGGGSWSSASDRRLKDVRGPFDRGLEAIRRIQPVYYRYRPENPLELPSAPEYVGLTAQEVERVIPEAVERDKGEYLHLNNDPILWAMLNAIRQLSERLDSLECAAGRVSAASERQEATAAEARTGMEVNATAPVACKPVDILLRKLRGQQARIDEQETELAAQRMRLRRQRARLETLQRRLRALERQRAQSSGHPRP